MKTKDLWTIQLSQQISMEFIRIPAGEFLMGSGDDDQMAHPSEKPQHPVFLSEYWVGKIPVTEEQFRVYQPEHIYNPDESHDPIVNVTWYEAQGFCIWLSKTSGLPIRLPTEAEWEKVARGTDGRIYPWGNEAPDSRYISDKIGGYAVGSYPEGASPYGVLDMAGNVFEWVSDWYEAEYYRHSPSENPKGPEAGTEKVMRGGDTRMDWWDLRVASRDYAAPNSSDFNGGFRCAFNLSEGAA
jgi:formylglycine-generating enzyme required for sulfatase activity